MDVVKIDVDRAKARELYQQYKDHRHYSTPVDDEIRKCYREIAKGGVVIRALESVKAAGVNEKGLPKLAIARADLSHVLFQADTDGSGVFMSQYELTKWRRTPVANSARIPFPAGTFPAKSVRTQRAVMPIIPVHLRPRHALDNYHVLWEAEWDPIPPRDPYLLRRIGNADLWLVLAAWDLTEVERAAMATRIRLDN